MFSADVMLKQQTVIWLTSIFRSTHENALDLKNWMQLSILLIHIDNKMAIFISQLLSVRGSNTTSGISQILGAPITPLPLWYGCTGGDK